MHSNLQFTRLAARGYTLPEVLVTVAIVSLVSIGVIGFTRQGINMYSYDAGRLRVNRDIRTFTQEMATNAEYANYFALFQNFTNARSSGNDTGGNPVNANLHDGQSGDFVVLVFANTDLTTGATKISRLIGYYRDPGDPTDPTSIGPVRKFDKPVSPPSTAALCTLLDTVAIAPTSTAHTNGAVIQLATGCAANGLLFYNYKDHSVMIKGQITETGSLTQNAVNTYNFTVSPRG
jgi:prepilin-type N-terminal cleavage/methylation domain-containing protein